MPLPPELAPPGRTRPLVFDALPGLAARPWMPLVHGPTPVVEAAALAPWLGRGGVWIKRDDVVSPIFGGNKVRRYEFLLAEAEAAGKKKLLTIGGIGSTQAMATALFGRALGLGVRLVLFDQPITRFVKEALRVDVAAGAELIYARTYVRTAWRTLRALAKDTQLIMPGASSAVANLGYVDAMLELAGQVERKELPRPDVIVVPAGSAGTLAALALGAAWLGWPTEIVGVRIAPWYTTNRASVAFLCGATDRLIARHDAAWRRGRAKRLAWSLYHGAYGGGYGEPTAAAIDAIAQVAALTGRPGEVTYSGKGLAGLRALAAEERWKDKAILWWNTLSSAKVAGVEDAAEVPEELRWVLEAPVVA